MWFRSGREKEVGPKPGLLDWEESSESGVFFETIRGPQEPLSSSSAETVLDLRPDGQRDPKHINHYYESRSRRDEGEIFYDIMPQAARPEMPLAFSPSRRMERLRSGELAELAVVGGVLLIVLTIGLALIYASLR